MYLAAAAAVVATKNHCGNDADEQAAERRTLVTCWYRIVESFTVAFTSGNMRKRR